MNRSPATPIADELTCAWPSPAQRVLEETFYGRDCKPPTRSIASVARALQLRGIDVTPQFLGALARGRRGDPATSISVGLRDECGISVDAWFENKSTE